MQGILEKRAPHALLGQDSHHHCSGEAAGLHAPMAVDDNANSDVVGLGRGEQHPGTASLNKLCQEQV
jgi:hypothetical protein